jgi:ankyrin repeat protein
VAPHPDATLQQALVFACMCGQLEIAQRLLDHGVDVNGGPRKGITAIHEASYQGQIEAVQLLLQRGADPKLRDAMWESTAIGWADGGKQSQLIDWLFANTKVDVLDAVELRRYAVVQRILQQDPSLANAPNGRGGALRHAAFKCDEKMVKLLLSFGADPSLRNDNGHTAIDYAKKANHFAIVKLLNEHVVQ